MVKPLVISVILNTNRRDDTLACLESIAAQSYPEHQVLVLDNASSDGSVEAIRERFSDVEILQLQENRGYAGNNNLGIQVALERGADWVFVLNEDTILDPDCIAALVGAGTQDSSIGIVGPLVYHYDEPTVIQSAGGVLDYMWEAHHIGQNEPDRQQYSISRYVDWISGCAILARREVIGQLGMLDERFFYYWEETEWCLRTKRAGWKILHAPQAKLWHNGVQRDYRPKPSVAYYNTRNKLLMMKKHRAPLIVWAMTIKRQMQTALSYSIRPKWRDKREHRDALLRGARDFLWQRWGRGQP